MTRIVSSLAEVSDGYDVLLCDLWGCVHDGRAAFPPAVAALRAFRGRGGCVVLLTNAPRSRRIVEGQLERLGVPRDAWDVVTTSGDSARAAMFSGVAGSRVHFMGYDSDHTIFEPLRIVEDPVEIALVPLEEAEGIICCGPRDPYADPDVHLPELERARERDLPLLCFNPDIVVDFGDRRQWCAGKIAEMYAGMGGRSLYFGKPHAPIYDLARRRLAALGRDVPDGRILCAGDGIHTDVAGAAGAGLDALFVTGGLAARETGTGEQPDPEALAGFLAAQGVEPAYSIGFLR